MFEDVDADAGIHSGERRVRFVIRGSVAPMEIPMENGIFTDFFSIVLFGIDERERMSFSLQLGCIIVSTIAEFLFLSFDRRSLIKN